MISIPSPRASEERDRERGFLNMASSPRPFPPQVCGGEGEIQAAQELRCARPQRGRTATKIFLQKKTKETKIVKNFAKNEELSNIALPSAAAVSQI
jgi:hypothetical protein